MKALAWTGAKNFEVQEIPQPVAAPGRIIVQVKAAAVCGSDSHLSDFGARPPLIPGHEVSGVVAEIGAGVTGLKAGDRVVLDPVQRCGDCWCCTHGVGHLCINYRHLGDLATPGGWAERVAIDAANAYRLPDNLSFEAAALVEPAAVCYESYERAALKPGDRVLILGDGPFGFLHAQMARARGAGQIIVAGHYDRRLERIAEKTGALICNTHRQDLSELLKRAIGVPGVDLVIEATGAGASPNVGIRALRPRGSMVIFSYIWKPDALEMGLIHMRELNLLGACRSLNAYQACLNLLASGKISTETLVDIKAPLTAHRAVMERLATAKSEVFKAVFLPET
ncbi:MAG: alcohol dehydrogenase catalytic domain-containing protein [bacterium]